MPAFQKKIAAIFLGLAAAVSITGDIAETSASEGIQSYYIRYDVKSSSHKITASKLTMVPAENDFRTENFSTISIRGVISAAPGESPARLERMAKEDGMKRVLKEKGLKSVKTRDLDTVVSYEGSVITPVEILPGRRENQFFHYTATIEFHPTPFPDRWALLRWKHKVKTTFRDILSWFN